MSKRKGIFQRWRELGITAKFTAAFGVLLALMVVIAITGTVALTVVRRETETAIVTSTDIQRLMLEMDGGLQEARRLEKDFFLRYPTLGYSAAYQTYAQQAEKHIAQVRVLSAELQQLISEPEVSDAWRESNVNLNLYLSAISRHAATVEQAANLVARLAADETGLQVQLTHNSSLLQDVLQLADDPDLMVLYGEMQSSEKDYVIARQRPLMQSAFNTAIPLRQAIGLAPTLEADQKNQALTYLDNYLTIAKEILELDVAIRSKFNEFDLQAEAVDPISEELIALANQEVERARAQIGQTSKSVTVILVATALAGLVLAGMVAQLFNNSITRNVVKLTQVAGELQAGNLEVRARIDSADELGQLADSFNAMATRINSLVDSLEQEVAERTAELTTANEQLQQEITERKRAEEALRESKEYTDNVIRSITESLIVVSPDGDIQTVNQATCNLLGYEEEEVVFKGSGLDDLIKKGSIRNLEKTYLSKDGRRVPVLFSGSVMRDDGKIQGIVCVALNITERKRAEEEITRLARFPSENPNPVLRVAKDGTILYANKASLPLSDVWGCQSGQLLPDYWRKFILDVLSSGASKDTEVDVEDRILSLTFAPVVDTDYINVYGLDVTERKRMEDQIQASLQQKELLLKEIHHRVRNNLQVVSSLLDFQSEHIEDKQTLDVFKESQNRVRSMALVHEQLYQSEDLARIDFAEYVQNLAAHLFRSYGVTWDAISLKINVDNVLLGVDTAIPCGLIIGELVSNSLRHAFPGGSACSERSESKGEIRIDLHSDDDKLTLIVSDNGVALPGDLDFPNTESLGLRLVNMLTRQLKGTIELDRSGGTTFKIAFARPKR